MSAQPAVQPATAAALPASRGGTIIAPGAPVGQSRGRRAVSIARDLVIAVAVVWALPLAAAILVALARFLANTF
jgi:hypothetical protein